MNRLDTIRYNLGEDEFLKWEARNDAAHDEELLTDEEREELEAEIKAELMSEIPNFKA